MDGIYEPELIQKGQTRINGIDDKIIHCPLGVAWWCRKL
jgi:transposase-like protein